MRKAIGFAMLMASAAATQAQSPSAIAAPTARVSAGTIMEWQAVPSAYVQPRNITIWLPPGYDASRQCYPVIYMHDGQNLFEPGHAYGGNEWGVDETMARMMIGQPGFRGAIVVGIWNTNLRGREYLPTKVAANLSPATRALVEQTHSGPSMADDYLRFIVTELKPRIDRTFRTRRDAAHTAIAGSSMGGLISLYAMGEYPRVFGSAAALSIHWPLGDPRQGHGAPPAEVAAAFDRWLGTTRLNPRVNRLYMDHGTINLDSYYRPYSSLIEPMLAQRGWREGRNWQHAVVEGGDHNEAAWRARLATPMAFVFAGL